MTPECFDQLAASLNDAVLLLSADGIVQGLNPAAMLALGIPDRDEICQQPLAELVTDRGRLEQLLHACRRSSEPAIGSLTFRQRRQPQRILARRICHGDDFCILIRIESQQIATTQFLALNEKLDQLNREIARRTTVEALLRTQRDMAEFGRDIGVALVQPAPLDMVLEQCAELIVDRLQAALARIWLADEQGQELRLVASRGMYTHVDGPHGRIRFGDFKIGRIAQQQTPHVSNQVVGDSEIHDQQWAIAHGIASFAGFPLIVDGVTVGVVAMFSKEQLCEAVIAALATAANSISVRVRKQSIEDGLAAQTRALREADRKKNEFLAMLSHELRNPLAPIRSGLDLLSLENLPHQETIELMQQQIEHVVRLVDDLLDVSRIMRGKVELRRTEVEVGGLVQTVVASLRSMIVQSEHTLELQLPPQPLWIYADSVRIKQVLENLLKNACKYTDPGGRIRLQCSYQEPWVTIVVEDNGIGIDAELLPEVFELFTQSTRALDRSQGGLGVGLTLVKNLIEMHEGFVEAFSEGQHRGARFAVHLPACAPPANSAAAPADSQPNERRLRILAVDDNRSARLVLAKLFAKLGPHEVRTASDGPTALQLLHDFPADVILLDIGLPGMDGFELAAAVRAHDGLANPLLVALTGYGHKEDRLKSEKAGFDLHLVKPAGIAQLRELLQHPKLS